MSGDGRLLVACGDRPPLHILSCEDGSTLGRLEGLDTDGTGDGEYPPLYTFSMQKNIDFAVFPDCTVLLYRDCDRSDEYGNYFELQRFDLDGNLLELWQPGEEKPGVIDRLKKWFGRKRRAPYFSDVSSYPVRMKESDLRLAIGPEGSVYMLSRRRLVRFSPSGEKVYALDFEDSYSMGRPVSSAAGEVFVLLRGDGDRNRVMRIPADGTGVTVALESVEDGGPVGNHEIVVACPDGSFSLLGYSGEWSQCSS